MKVVHNNIKDYECTVCGHKFGQNIQLIKHSKVHVRYKEVPDNAQDQAKPKRTEKYDCTCCDQKFNTERKVMKHGPHCTSDSFRRELVCRKCGFTSKKVSEWACHVKEPCGSEN